MTIKGTPIAIIRRFDRAEKDTRIPYLSAASMLQASREDTHSYTEIVDLIRQRSPEPDDDARELWRRLVFNLLITNTDDHLHNHGFLYAGNSQWQLAPAFDVNPMPNKFRESKTWLTPVSGPIVSIEMLIGECEYFSLTEANALEVLGEVLDAVLMWRQVGTSTVVGLTTSELPDFDDAFEHEITEEARLLLGRPVRRTEVEEQS